MGRGAIVGVTPTVVVRLFARELRRTSIYKDEITDSPAVVVAPTVGVTSENWVGLRLVIVVGVRETFSS